MGTPTRSRRIPAVLMTSVAVITALLSSACGGNSPESSEKEFENRGFKDVQQAGTGDNIVVYFTAGSCRFKAEGSLATGYKMVDKSSRGKESDLTVDEPSLAKLKQIPALAYCFAQPISSSVVPTTG